MKYQQSIKELQEQWDDQINFIRKSCESYDAGDFSEAKRLAVCIRILFHQTLKSKSLFSQLEYTDKLILWSSGCLYTPSNLTSSWCLLSAPFNGQEIQYRPFLKETINRTFFLNLLDWWNEIIFDDKEYLLSRKDIILFVSNKDGGAHVDPEFDESYANITKKNSLGLCIMTNEGFILPKNNPVYASIRQIACEILYSWELFNKPFNRIPYKDKKFEMRLVDKDKRFKWTTTDITASEETMAIVNVYNAESRTYYFDKFDSGIWREVIV